MLMARPAVRSLAASKIRELFNSGIGRTDILPFWVGEPDEPTPGFIRKAGMDSIAAGETFYTHNLGIPEIREALSVYVNGLHKGCQSHEVAVTSAGVNVLMLATQLLVDPGERVVEVVPLWPNLQEIPRILGAQVDTVALEFSPSGWFLDLDKLLKALTPGTRALYLNSPNNPTGWTVTRAEQEIILDHCRRNGIWIFADDAYERLYYEGNGVAPSFLDICGQDDRVISTNTFSKTWLMPGWRLGWLVVPAELTADLGKLIEYNTSCAPVFVQRAGVAALKGGGPVIAHSLQRFRKARDFLVKELNAIDGVTAASPAGGRGLRALVLCRQRRSPRGRGAAPAPCFGAGTGRGALMWCILLFAPQQKDRKSL
jgi:aspartate/methionine/tyrosine aminotransferase